VRKATLDDKALVTDIISKTFESNPGVNSIFKKNGNKTKMLMRFADYVFIKALNRHGIYISENEKGVALCFQEKQSRINLKELFYQCRFGFSSMPLLQLPRLLRRESFRRKQRSLQGDHYYFWFLGVLPGGSPAGNELKNAILEMAKGEKRTICLETTVERNKRVYERIGFKTYNTYTDPEDGVTFYMMKQEFKQPTSCYSHNKP
jgi:hypothetical protein